MKVDKRLLFKLIDEIVPDLSGNIDRDAWKNIWDEVGDPLRTLTFVSIDNQLADDVKNFLNN
jgi:hypothetical protein